MKNANLIVGAFVVVFCVLMFIGFTAQALDSMINLDLSGLVK